METDVPAGWRGAKLGELCDVLIGGTPSRAIDEYWDARKTSGNRWVSIADLKGHIVSDTKEYLTDEGVANSNVKRIRTGTVMMSFKLTIGRTAFAGCDLYTNEAIAAFVPKSELLDNNFLFHALPVVAEGGDVDQAIKGKTLNKAKLVELPIPLPPLTEQKKIAAILSSVDEAIRANDAVIEQTRLVKEGLLQELLTRGIGHTEFRETEIGPLPVEWAVQRVEDVAVRVTVGHVGNTSEFYCDTGIPLLRTGNVRRMAIDGTNVRHVTHSFADSLAKSRLCVGDVLVSRVGANRGMSAVVPSEWEGANCANIIIVRPGPTLLSTFLAFMINSSVGQHALLGASAGSAQGVINTKEVASWRIAVPPRSEQERIVGILGSVLDGEATGITSIAGLKRLKSGLLQDLLTGKVRVTP